MQPWLYYLPSQFIGSVTNGAVTRELSSGNTNLIILVLKKIRWDKQLKWEKLCNTEAQMGWSFDSLGFS
jgi:hypothetical protein